MFSGHLTEEEVKAQSVAAFSQSGEKWKRHAKLNGEIYKASGKTFKDLACVGWGKLLIIAGMAKSLEDHIDILRKYQNHEYVDIACCDKAFKILIEKGIKPKYVFLADANIKFDEWIKPVIHLTKDTTLIASICSNPEWSQKWLGEKYYYINKDNIHSEEIFSKISGCKEFIPASSNVGNTIVVFSTQIMGYKEYLLTGYDFSWEPGENYYAFNDNDKRYWMKDYQAVGINNKMAYTSGNLMFSCRWLADYFNGPIYTSGVKVFNCSGRGILNIPTHDLEARLEKFEMIYPNRDAEIKKKLIQANTVVISKENGGEERLLELFKSNELISAKIMYCPKQESVVTFA